MKKYTFKTFNVLKEEVNTFVIEAFNIKEARKIARNIIGNSRDNEVSNSKITLV